MQVEIFICYARKDRPFLDELKSHMMLLQRQGHIVLWHDGDISAGKEWEREIEKYLDAAQIILLLISPNFMASDYCMALRCSEQWKGTILERQELSL